MKFLKLFFLIILFLLTFYFTHKVKKETLYLSEDNKELDELAPDFKLKNIKGEEFQLSKEKENNLLLIFFATWCAPCKRELKEINNHMDKLNEYGLKLVLISNEEEEKVKKFLEENSFDFDVFLDSSSEVHKLYKVKAIPKSILLRKGYIVKSKTGAIVNFEEEILSFLSKDFKEEKREKIAKEKAEKILCNIKCNCTCGNSLLECLCRDCKTAKRKKEILNYCQRLIYKENFKEWQVEKIIEWKYIENIKEEKNGKDNSN